MKVTLAAIALAALLTVDVTRSHAHRLPGGEVTTQENDKSQYVGTWEKEGGDSNAHQKITLTLRADGTYRKTLQATVGGVPYGGTHEGTWTAKDSVVNLSGDSKWPAYSHDLSEFRKIR